MPIQCVDIDIITTHIAHLEAEAIGHRERATAGQGPYPDPLFLGYATEAEGGVKALRAVLAEAEARVPHTPTADHVTDGAPCWCDPHVETVPAKKSATESVATTIEGDDR